MATQESSAEALVRGSPSTSHSRRKAAASTAAAAAIATNGGGGSGSGNTSGDIDGVSRATLARFEAASYFVRSFDAEASRATTAAADMTHAAGASGVAKPSAAQQLRLYALYKQSRQGPCRAAVPTQPSYLLHPQAARKWAAWDVLGDTPRGEAMRAYASEVDRMHPGWARWPQLRARFGDRAADLILASEPGASTDDTSGPGSPAAAASAPRTPPAAARRAAASPAAGSPGGRNAGGGNGGNGTSMPTLAFPASGARPKAPRALTRSASEGATPTTNGAAHTAGAPTAAAAAASPSPSPSPPAAHMGAGAAEAVVPALQGASVDSDGAAPRLQPPGAGAGAGAGGGASSHSKGASGDAGDAGTGAAAAAGAGSASVPVGSHGPGPTRAVHADAAAASEGAGAGAVAQAGVPVGGEGAGVATGAGGDSSEAGADAVASLQRLRQRTEADAARVGALERRLAALIDRRTHVLGDGGGDYGGDYDAHSVRGVAAQVREVAASLERSVQQHQQRWEAAHDSVTARVEALEAGHTRLQARALKLPAPLADALRAVRRVADRWGVGAWLDWPRVAAPLAAVALLWLLLRLRARGGVRGGGRAAVAGGGRSAGGKYP